MRIFLNVMIFLTAMLITMAVTFAFAGDTMLACTQADGTVLYTNKDVKGCTIVVGPELSVVPSYPQTHNNEQTKNYNLPEIPTLNIREPNPLRDKICPLYEEWIDLNLSTRGGMYVFDTRYNVLNRLFGGGFMPLGCI